MKLTLLSVGVCAVLIFSVQTGSAQTSAPVKVLGCLQGDGSELKPWVLSGVALPPPPPAVPPAGAGGGGTPPDISGLSPRQRFDTLYNVVMRASEGGDAARAAQFLPMALMAYGQLDDVDADSRYHLAVLRLHVEGDSKPALLLADTIQATSPHHLLALMIRGSAGQLAGDQAMTRTAAKEFLSAWEVEIASGKPEYRDHRGMLDQFRERALKTAATGKT